MDTGVVVVAIDRAYDHSNLVRFDPSFVYRLSELRNQLQFCHPTLAFMESHSLGSSLNDSVCLGMP